ncbi:hypothetical protein BOX24_00550 [Leptospirillum ferriphilum]|uniref:Uncharacterized protein n=1 Tax=Leptospirillum ferriphilum TaxID=178606 RepID=A0A1V3SXY7_9BACT|nr:hypothetical protein BOX24_00550 [Leptospirillum ferriphilum]
MNGLLRKKMNASLTGVIIPFSSEKGPFRWTPSPLVILSARHCENLPVSACSYHRLKFMFLSTKNVSSHERRVEVFKNGLHEMNTAKRGKETAPTAPENFGGISLQDSVVLFF